MKTKHILVSKYRYYLSDREKELLHRKKKLDYQRRRKREAKARLIALLGGKYQVCGIKEPMVLAVHHPLGRKNYPIGGRTHYGPGMWSKYLKEFEAGVPLNLLCFNHHFLVTRDKISPPPPRFFSREVL